MQSTASALPAASQALDGMEAGWAQSLERPAELLGKLAR